MDRFEIDFQIGGAIFTSSECLEIMKPAINSSSIMAYGSRHTLVERHSLNYIVKRNSLNKAIHHLLSKVIHCLLYKVTHRHPASLPVDTLTLPRAGSVRTGP